MGRDRELAALSTCLEGQALIERARAVFEEIGATGWIDETQGALGG